ncbi:hypothetical protein [Mycobacterium canetti]|uniref:hypothetical protein n=1 Tax=Mycobacterium canetti TaxID=78331 RepID=UPI00034A9E10|nr:hypothetical protein [Mycobacterium canetti]
MPKIGPYTVYLRDEDGTVHTFLPGVDVPAWAAKQMGDHCFAAHATQPQPHKEHHSAPSSGGGVGPPPRAGAGSGRDAWAAYAQANGVGVDDDWKRDQIISACEQAGVAVE